LKEYILRVKNKDKSYFFKFRSQTDTEVIVNLISFEYLNMPSEGVEKAILRAVKRLQGTYALAILDLKDPNRLYCIRNGSPLLVGVTEDFALVTSEKSGFNGEMVDYYVLDNNNLCILERKNGKIEFHTERNSYETLTVSKEDKSHTTPLGNSPHYTLKEIYEQPKSTFRALCNGGRLLSEHEVKLGGLDGFKNKLTQIQHVIILGCGTSYHAGMIGVNYFKDVCHFKTVQLFDGAEFTERDFPAVDNTEKIGVLFLSQSGETRDLYR
jgi:glucosamine--fructose-6-phosphate aminotransferase (isomerizing)